MTRNRAMEKAGQHDKTQKQLPGSTRFVLRGDRLSEDLLVLGPGKLAGPT